MQTSIVGCELIKSFEGTRLRCYKDVAGLWTVGVGHLMSKEDKKRWPVPSATLTDSEVKELFQVDLEKFEVGVSNILAGLVVNQNQFDALVSLAYNIGLKALAGSTLIRLLRLGKVSAASDEFLRWTRSGGKVIEGLKRRRGLERELFRLAQL